MKVGNYTFSCIVVSPMVLPRHKGSVIQGALGASLKRVSCALRHQRCNTCILRERCIYVSFFERLPPVPGSPKWLNVRPSPFILEPPDTERQDFNPDTRFSFNILLVAGLLTCGSRLPRMFQRFPGRRIIDIVVPD